MTLFRFELQWHKDWQWKPVFIHGMVVLNLGRLMVYIGRY